MKHSLRCPQCDGRKLWRIETLRYEDAHQGNRARRVLQLALHREKPVTVKQSAWSKVMDGDKNHYTTGSFDAWVCAACSYVELWAEGLDDLEHNPEAGVHFIDATPEQGGFR